MTLNYLRDESSCWLVAMSMSCWKKRQWRVRDALDTIGNTFWSVLAAMKAPKLIHLPSP